MLALATHLKDTYNVETHIVVSDLSKLNSTNTKDLVDQITKSFLDTVMYTMEGIGLGDHMKLITVLKKDATTTCDKSKNTLEGGKPVVVTSDNDENTGGHVNLTIGSTTDSDFEHVLCVMIPTENGDDDGVSYRPATSTPHLV